MDTCWWTCKAKNVVVSLVDFSLEIKISVGVGPTIVWDDLTFEVNGDMSSTR